MLSSVSEILATAVWKVFYSDILIKLLDTDLQVFRVQILCISVVGQCNHVFITSIPYTKALDCHVIHTCLPTRLSMTLRTFIHI